MKNEKTHRIKLTNLEPTQSTAESIYIPSTKKLSENITTNVSKTPIVTYSAENAFVFDTGSTGSFTINFERANGTDDGNFLNNRDWIAKMRSFINRWQSRHDGYLIEYNDDKDAHEFYDHVKQKGYLKSFTTTFKAGDPEHITGSITFQMGSMRAQNGKTALSNNPDVVPESEGYGEIVDFEKMYVQISTSDNLEYYTVFASTDDGSDYSCVTSYELTHGPTDPFPFITLRISKKRLTNLAPVLEDDIKPGMNRLVVNACGTGDFLVTKCSTSRDEYKITAYSFEEAYKGILLSEDMECGPDTAFETPGSVISDILQNQFLIGDIKSIYFESDNIFFEYDQKTDSENNIIANTWYDKITFPKDTSLWTVMSACAMRMNCSIWFEGGKAYIVDLSLNTKDRPQVSKYFKGKTYLNNVPFSPENIELLEFCESVQDTPTLGDEGTDTLINTLSISARNSEGKNETCTTEKGNNAFIDASIEQHNVRSQEVSIENIGLRDAKEIVKTNPMNTCDTQISISYKITEMSSDGKRWHAYYPPITHIEKIIDHNTDSILSNWSNFKVELSETVKAKQQLFSKLALSTVTRKFPDFSSEYTFGRIANADLSQSMSEVLNAIGKR